MSKWYPDKWRGKAADAANATTYALQTIYDSLNHGQQQKLLTIPEVARLLAQYGVQT